MFKLLLKQTLIVSCNCLENLGYMLLYKEVDHTSEVNYGRGYVYSIQYHVVWCMKYRHKVLMDDIDARLKEMLHQIAVDKSFTTSEIESDYKSVHLLMILHHNTPFQLLSRL